MNPSPYAGAIKSPEDPRDYLHSEVAYGSSPFNWEQGCSTLKEIAPIGLKVKDQGQSGSCGGQAEAYGGAVLEAVFNPGHYEEKSAKFTYAPICVSGGGTVGRDLANRAISAGWGSEALTPSTMGGQPPTESFMEDASVITPEANAHALTDRALNYTLVGTDIDSVAQAIRDFKFVRLGVVGSNNGTWLSPTPVPPTDSEQRWYHWLAAFEAQMVNGKKAIHVVNSWGTQAGEFGWQWLTEDYFKAPLTNDSHGTTPIFEPRCYVWNNQLPPAIWHHTFNSDLQYGMVDPEVQNLQIALQKLGFFSLSVPTTTYFGVITQSAVGKYQMANCIAQPGTTGFGRCGPLTRAALNKHFA